MILNLNDYRQKVLGCWMGKNIGGTIGAPFEWKRQVNDVSFYTQELGGNPLPNDDLDIQLLWLVALEERGIALDAHTLAEYWCLYVTPHWSEYGTAKINMRAGIPPALSGTRHNPYKDSCGAFIRSEIWACICPGNPALAARYAYEDAILDHGDGEGTYAEVFCAALEAAAFVESDLRKLIDIGLSYIPADCATAQATRTAISCHERGLDWKAARDEVLAQHRGGAFFGWVDSVAKADREKGFHTGRRGFDVPSNIGLLVVALLTGGTDFGKVVCTATNCGEDTDCTAATAGAIFGIIHGIAGIPQRWIDPIGRSIKTACLNLGELGFFGNQLPQSVDELTDRTERICRQVLLRHKGLVQLDDVRPSDGAKPDSAKLMCPDQGATLFSAMRGTRHVFDFFTVEVDYGSDAGLRDGQAKRIRLRIRNTYKTQANLTVRWYAPANLRIGPASEGAVLSFPRHLGTPIEIDFTVSAERLDRALTRAVIEITAEGRPLAMLVPVTLINANLDVASEIV